MTVFATCCQLPKKRRNKKKNILKLKKQHLMLLRFKWASITINFLPTTLTTSV